MSRPNVSRLLLAILCAVPASAADAPTAAEKPFALTPLTPAQINAASPFYLIDGRSSPLLATPPARLEDLQVLRLWAGRAPLQAGDDPKVDVPTVTVFLPPPGKASGAAMVVMPGGGYDHLSPREGLPTAQWLAGNGIAAFVLKSRVGPKYHHPAEMNDAQRAIRYVRAHAAGWDLDPARVGIIGFSAGGHLASTAATHYDSGDSGATDPVERASSRPDLQILVYPVVSLSEEAIVHKSSRTMLVGTQPDAATLEFLSGEKHVAPDAPPAFVVHSMADRTVPVANSDRYVAALTAANVPFVYLRAAIGGHGFGITDDWAPAAMAWLHSRKF
jgi:acetyl esterase/lipase